MLSYSDMIAFIISRMHFSENGSCNMRAITHIKLVEYHTLVIFQLNQRLVLQQIDITYDPSKVKLHQTTSYFYFMTFHQNHNCTIFMSYFCIYSESKDNTKLNEVVCQCIWCKHTSNHQWFLQNECSIRGCPMGGDCHCRFCLQESILEHTTL